MTVPIESWVCFLVASFLFGMGTAKLLVPANHKNEPYKRDDEPEKPLPVSQPETAENA